MNNSLPSILSVANFYIQQGNLERIELSLPKIQRLCFLAYGWHLAFYGKPLSREFVTAYSYGPIFLTLFNAGKGLYGGEEPVQILFEGICNVSPDESGLALMSKVWEVYKNYSSEQLSRMVTKEGSLWEETLKANPGRENPAILDKDIEEHYLNILANGYPQ